MRLDRLTIFFCHSPSTVCLGGLGEDSGRSFPRGHEHGLVGSHSANAADLNHFVSFVATHRRESSRTRSVSSTDRSSLHLQNVLSCSYLSRAARARGPQARGHWTLSCVHTKNRPFRIFVFSNCARAADTALCLKAKGPFSKIISTCKKDCKPVLDDDDDDTLGHINGCAANTAVKHRSRRTRNRVP